MTSTSKVHIGDPPVDPVVRARIRLSERNDAGVFGSYARLAPGESFLLVSDHDPKTLRRLFAATYPGQVEWEYLEAGPAQWWVRIGRPSLPPATS